MSHILFGGLFDPPHLGHMETARAALEKIKPEKLVWIPSRYPPHRNVEGIPAFLRYDMLERWARKRPGHSVSDIELQPGHSGYTIETVERYSDLFPGAQLCLLIGSDEAEKFSEWKEWEKLISRVRLVVARRKNEVTLPAGVSSSAVMLDNPVIECSSSLIRERLRSGEPVDGMLDPEIRSYILERSLYRK